MKHTKQHGGMSHRIMAFFLTVCMVTTLFSPIVSVQAEGSTAKPIFLNGFAELPPANTEPDKPAAEVPTSQVSEPNSSNTEPDKPASKMVSSWQWNDPDGHMSEGVLALPGVSKENPVNLDALISMLPASILATLDPSQPSNTSMPPVEMAPVEMAPVEMPPVEMAPVEMAPVEMPPVEMPPEDSKNSTPVSISLAWSSKDFVQAQDGSFPVQGEYTFTATMEEGYTLSTGAPSLEITVRLGGAMMLPSNDMLSNGIFKTLEIREGTATGTKVVDLLDANSIAGNWALKPGADYYIYADLIAPTGAEYIKIQYGGADAPNGVTFANPPGGEYEPHPFNTHDYLDALVSYRDLANPTYGSNNQAYPMQDGEMIYHIKKKDGTSNTVFAIGLVVKDAMYDGSGSIKNAFSVAVGSYANGSFTPATGSTQTVDLKIAEKGKFNSFLSPQTLNAAIGENGANGAMQYLANIATDQPEILYDEVSFDLTYPTGAELAVGFNEAFSKTHTNLGTMTVAEAVPSDDGKTQTVHVIVQKGLKDSSHHGSCFVRLNFPENSSFKPGEEYFLKTAHVQLTMGTTPKTVDIKNGGDKLCYTLTQSGQDETWMIGYDRIAYNHTMDVPPQSYLVPLGNAMIGNTSTTLPTPYEKTFEAKYNDTNTAANVSYITIPVGLNTSPAIEWSGIAADGAPKTGTIPEPSSYQNKAKTFYLLPASAFGIVSFTGAKADIGALPAEYRSAAGATSWLFERNNLSGAYGYFTTNEPGIQVVNKYRLYNTDPALRDKPKGDLSATATGTSTDYCGIGWEGNPKLNGKALKITDPSASINAGEFAKLSGTLFPYTAPNNGKGNDGTRGTATLIMDPIIYLTLPQGMSVVETDLSFTIDERSFYNSTPTTKTISYQIENVSYLNTTGDNVSIYKITFPKGTRLGYFDEKGIQSNLNYTIPLLTSKSLETRRYGLSELLCVTAQNRPEATKYDGQNAGAINYALADKYGINGGKPLGTVSRETGNSEGTKVDQAIGFGVQQSSEINLYSAASVTKIGGKEIPAAEQRWYAYSSDPNSIALLGQNSEGRLRLQVSNTSETPGTGLRIILPIPQKDADLGDAFMDGKSGFTMSMTYDGKASDPKFTATYIKTTGIYDTITDKENIVTYTACTQAEANAVLLTANDAVGKGESYIYLDFVVADGTPTSMDIWRPVYAYNVATDRRVTNGSYVASEVAASSISGVAFADVNRNGKQDEGEGGAADVTVVARDAKNRIVSTKTDNNGAYQFLAIRESMIDMSFALGTEGQQTLRFNVPPLSDTATGIASTVTPAPDGLTASKTFTANAGEEKVHAAVDGFVSLSYDGGKGGNTGSTGNLPKTGTHVRETQATVAVKPDNLAVKGYRFTGWNTAEDGTGTAYQPGASIQMSQSVTLYAQWELASYTVTFNYRGATSGNDESGRVLKHGDTYGKDKKLPTPEKNGYTFDGWVVDTTKPKTKVIDTTKFALGADTMLYALWTPRTMEVTYHVNGGSDGITPKTVSWEAAVLPTTDEAKVITKNGYTLSGWTHNGTAVTKLDTYGNLAKTDTTTSIELVAQWKAKTGYTVQYDLAGGTVDSATIPDKTGVKWTQNGLLPAKNPVKDNFSFKGWLCGSEAVTGSTTYGALAKTDTVTNITLTAQWETKSANTVMYDTAGGSPISEKTGVATGASGLLPTEATKKPGYSLTGWKAGTKDVTDATVYSALSSTDTLTLTAQWAEKTYTIQYIPGNGSTIPAATKKWTDQSLLPTPTPTTKGYTFGGWYDGTTVVTANTPVSALIPQDDRDSITLTAKWNERTYTVYYDSDGGTTFPQKNQVKYTAAGLLPDVSPTKRGYSFRGWMCVANPVTASTTCGALLLNDTDSTITLVAQWETKTGFTVQYDTGGGTPNPSPKTVAWNDTNLLPTDRITKSDYTLNGWLSGRTGVTNATAFSALAQSDQLGTGVTLVAQWTENGSNTVKYETGGGTGIPDLIKVKATDKNLLPSADPQRAGYQFAGWKFGNTSVTKDTVYSALTSEKVLTLTAQWTEKSNYIVKYDTDGGTAVAEKTGVKWTDNNLLPPTNPTKSGYIFEKWQLAGTDVSAQSTYGALAVTEKATITLTAQWRAEPGNAPDISGEVEDERKKPVEGAKVKLTQGSKLKYGPVTTDAKGKYRLNDLKAGIYNLVAEKDKQTVTVIITVADEDLKQTLTLPTEKKNSVLEVTGSGTPAVVVGNLEEIAKQTPLDPSATSLTITLTVEKEEEQISTKVVEHTAIRQSAGANANILFLDAVLTKQVNTNPPDDIGENNSVVLEMVIPFDLTGKENVRVYRHHGAVDAFQKLDTKPAAGAAVDETCYLDVSAGLIHVYAKKFSTYAIAFDNPGGGGGSNPGGGSGGGGGTVPDVTVPPTRKPWTPVDTGVASVLQTKEHIKYINGYVDLTVGPERNMTRAEAAQMFYNLLLDQTPSAQVTFSDVPAGAWYAKAVSTLTALGIFKGYADGTFGAENRITREEFCAIATRFASVTGVESIADFSDVTTDMWSYDSIMQASALGWVNGFENGVFLPENNITRSEVVTIVNHMLGRKADVVFVHAHKDMVKFTDLQDTAVWYYYDIVEASMEHQYVRGVDGVESWTNTQWTNIQKKEDEETGKDAPQHTQKM